MPTLFYRDPDTGEFLPVVGGGNDHGGLFGLGDDDHPHYQTRAQKGVADGYASLSASTKVPIAQLPVGTTAASTVADGGHTHTDIGYRPITVSTAAPSGGADGDVWLTYV
jgi:hypothetical protein